MKNLFNNISDSEKQRILEMHENKKVISEQPDSKFDRRPAAPKSNLNKPITPKTGTLDDSNIVAPLLDNPFFKNFHNDVMGDGVEFEVKSSNVMKIFGPTGVWTLSKSKV